MRVIGPDRLLRAGGPTVRVLLAFTGFYLLWLAVSPPGGPGARIFAGILGVLFIAGAVFLGALPLAKEDRRPPLTLLLSSRHLAVVRADQIVDLVDRADIGLIVPRASQTARGVILHRFDLYGPGGDHIASWHTNWGFRGSGMVRRELTASGYPWTVSAKWSRHSAPTLGSAARPAWASAAVAGKAPSAEVPDWVGQEPYTHPVGRSGVVRPEEVELGKGGGVLRVSPAGITARKTVAKIPLHQELASTDVRLVVVGEILCRVLLHDATSELLVSQARPDRLRRALTDAGYPVVDETAYDGRFLSQAPTGPCRARSVIDRRHAGLRYWFTGSTATLSHRAAVGALRALEREAPA